MSPRRSSGRLQHFIDRKIATLFEPLIELQKDETLQGLPRGFAFRVIEALGVIRRADVANEVKDLDPRRPRGTPQARHPLWSVHDLYARAFETRANTAAPRPLVLVARL